MFLSPIGAVAYYQWRRTFDLRENVFIDEFIIMPDHIHAIVWVGDRQKDYKHNPFELMRQNPDYQEIFGPQNSILAKTVQAYKSAVTHEIRKNHDDKFSWQRGYYERIIRSESELDNIRQYIRQNPIQL